MAGTCTDRSVLLVCLSLGQRTTKREGLFGCRGCFFKPPKDGIFITRGSLHIYLKHSVQKLNVMLAGKLIYMILLIKIITDVSGI